MSSTTVFLAATLVRDHDREINGNNRRQLQLHGALAYLGYRDDRIVEYKPHDGKFNYTQAVEYCHSIKSVIAQPVDKKDSYYGVQCR